MVHGLTRPVVFALYKELDGQLLVEEDDIKYIEMLTSTVSDVKNPLRRVQRNAGDIYIFRLFDLTGRQTFNQRFEQQLGSEIL